MYNDTNNAQQAKAKRIIRKALGMGLAVSVSDGDGGYEIEYSTDYAAILAAIGEMDMDELNFYTVGKWCGWMLLVWEFGGDADELAADYTANETMEALAAA